MYITRRQRHAVAYLYLEEVTEEWALERFSILQKSMERIKKKYEHSKIDGPRERERVKVLLTLNANTERVDVEVVVAG